MKDRIRLTTWDIALLAGILLYITVQMPERYSLIVGLTTVLILTNCIKNHIAAYKFSGKIY
ncbi:MULTISPECIES: hypothetical protein [unclassified Mucilaginibacter]|uniref:hypothetical protein n=1 Tax=unclassified Mucilaginibacter TaxID=2617802 RepID=UPI0025D9A714|nr:MULTISPECIES: hypothetical protein [unclassified Mucilaginibacter]MEB0262160.1 hypothetical protein [Mucilaginibacter sp. 10I4]MEB0279821.1 hypothetical protein [Mucilaginibacter sp. 10B2]WPX24207.1 hypothetical protein RHM67_02820 [Mucilaginibacter sp. 5C4]